MADTLSADLKASLTWAFRETLDLSVISDNSSLAYSKSLVDGVAIDTADKIWHDERTILTTANDDLDLTNLTHSIFGATVAINLARVKAILILNLDTNTGDELLVKADATNGFTGWCNGVTTSVAFIGPDSPLLLANKKDGWATSGSSKILRINNPNAGSVIYRIAILGTST